MGRSRRTAGRLALLAAFACCLAFVDGARGADAPACPRQPQPSVAGCSLHVSGNQARGTLKATATFTIAPGFEDVRVTLASYEKPGPRFAVTYPQQLSASATGVFDAGGPYTLELLLPQQCGFFQVDLVVGNAIAPTIASRSHGYRAQGRLLAAATGGNVCETAVPPSIPPSATVTTITRAVTTVPANVEPAPAQRPASAPKPRATDRCPNLPGRQAKLPRGKVKVKGKCVSKRAKAVKRALKRKRTKAKKARSCVVNGRRVAPCIRGRG